MPNWSGCRNVNVKKQKNKVLLISAYLKQFKQEHWALVYMLCHLSVCTNSNRWETSKPSGIFTEVSIETFIPNCLTSF